VLELNNRLIPEFKVTFRILVPKCPDTYGHFGTGAEVSWVRSVLDPKCLYSVKYPPTM